MNKYEKVITKFHEGLNCSQVVLLAFAKELGIDDASVLKIACGFGGGMGHGEVCGAVSGAIMALGLKYGQSDILDTASKLKTSEVVKEFVTEFKCLNNSITCRDLLGCDLNTDSGKNYVIEKQLFLNTCPKFIKDSIDILRKLL